MRNYCLHCTLKHLGQAFVLHLEAEQGYFDHYILVIGHLSEASEECIGISPELANEIRQYRVLLMENIVENKTFNIPYFELFNEILQLIKDKGCGNCKKASEDFKNKIKERLEK